MQISSYYQDGFRKMSNCAGSLIWTVFVSGVGYTAYSYIFEFLFGFNSIANVIIIVFSILCALKCTFFNHDDNLEEV